MLGGLPGADDVTYLDEVLDLLDGTGVDKLPDLDDAPVMIDVLDLEDVPKAVAVEVLAV